MKACLMKLIFKDKFKEKLDEITLYIAKDSKTRARAFKSELKSKILSLPHFPYKFRKSLYADDENVRDFVFKGYTIPYLIEADAIVILTIFKHNVVDKGL